MPLLFVASALLASSGRISTGVVLNLRRRAPWLDRQVERPWNCLDPWFHSYLPHHQFFFLTSSTARIPTRASTLMRLLPKVWPFRPPSSPPTPLRRLKTFLTLPLFPSVSRLLAVSWTRSSSVTPPFSPKVQNILHLLTTNLVYLFKCTKKSTLARRTTCLASLSCLAFLLHLVVSLKLKLPLILMPTVFLTSVPRTRLVESSTASPSLMARVVSRRRFSAWGKIDDSSFTCTHLLLAAAARITPKNGLESYAYNLPDSLNKKFADKFDAADKEKLEDAVNDTVRWLNQSQEASKEEYEEKQKRKCRAVCLLLCSKDFSSWNIIVDDQGSWKRHYDFHHRVQKITHDVW